jgi:hypothetical protein
MIEGLGYLIGSAVTMLVVGGGAIFSYGKLSRKVDNNGEQMTSLSGEMTALKKDIKDCTVVIGDHNTQIGQLQGYRNGLRDGRELSESGG